MFEKVENYQSIFNLSFTMNEIQDKLNSYM